MQKLLSSFALIFFSLHLAYSTNVTAPVFMCSNTYAFTGRNLQEINVVSAENVANFETPISQYITEKKEKAEVMVVFVEPRLLSEQFPLVALSYDEKPNGGAFGNLKKLIETSKSSLVIPYTSAHTVGTEIINTISTSIPSKGKVYIVGESKSNIESATHLTLSELMEKIK